MSEDNKVGKCEVCEKENIQLTRTIDILQEVTDKLSGLMEVSEDEGSFNITINTHNSFNFDWTYTTIIIHNDMYKEDPNYDNTLAYVFVSYEWKWLSSARVNNKVMTDDDFKELFNYLKIAELIKK